MRNILFLRPSLPIRYVIPLSLVTLIILSVGLTGLLAFQGGQRAVEAVAERWFDEIAARIDQHLHNEVESLLQGYKDNFENVAAGFDPKASVVEIERFFWDRVPSQEAISYIYYATEKEGVFVGVDKDYEQEAYEGPVSKIRDDSTQFGWRTYPLDESGQRSGDAIRVKKKDEYEPRERPWYRKAKQEGKMIWVPYTFGSPPELAIAWAKPITDTKTGNLSGVLAVDILASEVKESLGRLKLEFGVKLAFVVPFLDPSSSSEPLPNCAKPEEFSRERILASLGSSDSGEAVRTEALKKMCEHYKEITDSWSCEEDEENCSPPALSFESENEWYHVHVQKSDVGFIAVVIAEETLMKDVYATTYRTILSGLLVLVLATALGLVIARWITQPILALTDAAAAVEAEAFRPQMLESVVERTDELGQLARVFQRMAGEVAARTERLTRQLQELRIQIDESEKSRKVAQITETEYFQQLQEKAKRLRTSKTTSSGGGEE